jgi:LEA14-like dessication related protein
METTVLLIGGAAFLLWFLGSGATVVSNLKFIENGMTFDVSNPLRIVINLSVIVQNPTSGSVTLQSLAGYFFINGSQSGNVSDFIPSVIQANSQTQLNLILSVNDIALVGVIMNYINSGSSSVVVNVQATANVSGVAIPVNLSFTPLN